jgi:hypothetical protein
MMSVMDLCLTYTNYVASMAFYLKCDHKINIMISKCCKYHWW